MPSHSESKQDLRRMFLYNYSLFKHATLSLIVITSCTNNLHICCTNVLNG